MGSSTPRSVSMICCELYPSSTPELHLHLGLGMMALAQFRVGTPREFASPLVQADGETDRCRLIMRCAHLTGVYVYDRYELSLTGSYVAAPVGPSNPKRRKTEPAADVPDASAGGSAVEGDAVVSRVNVDDFDAMRDRISAYDSAREDVIKRCRDPQKMSKQAIYAMHRGNLDGAREQLEKAKSTAAAIFDERIKDASTLRYGSYSNALEEYAEGALFLTWLDSGDIAPMDAPGLELLDPPEYIGGLVDFTGEVGRVAVMAATRRDQPKVEQALAAALTVQDALMCLGMPSKLAKKEGALRTNIKKIEHVLYELSLVKATGRNVTASVEDAPADHVE
eukprot:m.100943 g.100943  ORF g.100943 m.100943 type:complete len:337 (-) comp20708_c0_seq7:123-1133(-)